MVLAVKAKMKSESFAGVLLSDFGIDRCFGQPMKQVGQFGILVWILGRDCTNLANDRRQFIPLAHGPQMKGEFVEGLNLLFCWAAEPFEDLQRFFGGRDRLLRPSLFTF